MSKHDIRQLNEESKFIVESTYGDDSRANQHKPFDNLMVDVNELANKPRRFWGTLRILVSQNAKTSVEREYLLEAVDVWASASENGVFGEVLKYARRKPGAVCKNEYLNEEVSDKPYEDES